eukprot:scaffold137785_cov112-Phaeocystis_antarctica.AAC.1
MRLLANLLKEQGNLAEAISLFTEELETHVLLHGNVHEDTWFSAYKLAEVLRKAGQHEEAEALAAKHPHPEDDDDDDDDDDGEAGRAGDEQH